MINVPTNKNTSATDGFLFPKPQTPPFNGLSFEEFLQTLLVGVSGLAGDLVRPKWQLDPPSQPDGCVNWLSIGLNEEDADTFAYTAEQPDQSYAFMRMEALSLQCSFYGPDSLYYARQVRDNLQILQNTQMLARANMSFTSTSRLTRVPDLVNEQWVNRWEMTIYLRLEVLRTYPILPFLSASATLKANNAGGVVYTVPIAVTENT